LVEELEKYLKKGVIVTNQLEYNLVARNIEKEILPFSRKKGIQVVGWSPLESGFLTGKYYYGYKFEENDFRNKFPLFQVESNFIQAKPLFDLMDNLAKKYEVSIAQIALNWIIEQEVIPIPAAKNVEQVESNINAASFKLESEEYKQLSEVSKDLDLERY
jgi:aryl-alcohol dehydrogenase-like predicted oxidoreductase